MKDICSNGPYIGVHLQQLVPNRWTAFFFFNHSWTITNPVVNLITAQSKPTRENSNYNIKRFKINIEGIYDWVIALCTQIELHGDGEQRCYNKETIMPWKDQVTKESYPYIIKYQYRSLIVQSKKQMQ